MNQDKKRARADKNEELHVKKPSIVEQITPLAQQINCLDIEQVATVCIEKIPSLVGVRCASLYLLDEINNILYLQKCNHPFQINKIVSLNQNPQSPMVMAVKNHETICVEDIDTHENPVIKRSQRRFIENYKTKNCAIAPLICQNKVVGVLNLADKLNNESFNFEDIALIGLLSQLIGASIGNIQMFGKIQYQATTDGLTGLVNHRTFYEVLEKELWRSRRYGGTISLIMIDVDNLKRINDTYGHRAGDKVIKEVSSQIKMCIRQIDTAARYGGDEFAVILPNTSLEEATIVSERMVNSVSNSIVTWKKQQIKPSISLGLGRYGSEATPEDMTSRSDKALYTAKKVGGNAVKVFKSSLN